MKPVRSFIVRFPVTSDAGGDGCSCNGGGGEEVEEEEQVVVVVGGGLLIVKLLLLIEESLYSKPSDETSMKFHCTLSCHL